MRESASAPANGAADRILVVDDEEVNARMLGRILRKAGYEQVRVTTDARQVLSLFQEFDPDLLVLDLRMPHLDGFEIMAQLCARIPDDDFFPILVITGEASSETKQQALAEGATDFLTKPFDPVEVVLRVRNLLETRSLHVRLESKVRARTHELEVAQIELAERLALVAELRDYGGGEHTQRVGHAAARVAQHLGIEESEIAVIRRAAPLHDIGKIAIPDEILLREGPLTLEEMDTVKAHTTLGAKMLSGSSSHILHVAEEIALYHHEHWDGTGYTPGLAAESVPLVGRIVAVADVWDALVHERPYKDAWAEVDALKWIEEQRRSKFDPDVVDAFRDVHTGGELAEPHDADTEWSETLASIRTALDSSSEGAAAPAAAGDAE